ncbi:MAG: class I SAM-dependent methyltransferase [Solirubrobacteraceae bacterium]
MAEETNEPSDRLQADLAECRRLTGDWTAHNIELRPGVFTKGSEPSGEELKLRRILQLVADLAVAPMDELRVIDLGALEGLYGLELALRGAEVVFVEGREVSAAKIRFAARELGLERVEVRTEDVRRLSSATHGHFDVVLCLGLLYHLDHASLLELLARMLDVCRGVLVLDTHIALEDDELNVVGVDLWIDPAASLSSMREVSRGGRTYRGRDYLEHRPEAGDAERLGSLWASLDNGTSFWPTRPSLLSALVEAGFTSVLECHAPPLIGLPPDRVTLVALGGAQEALRTSTILAEVPYERIPERRR